MTNHSYLNYLRSGKAVLLFIAFLFASFSADAQTTWTGAADTNWANAANWTAGVPDVADAVAVNTTIPNAPIIGAGTAAVVNSINITATGTLTIAANGSLTTHSTALATNAMVVAGNLVNEGTIEIQNSTSSGIVTFNNGNFTNRGDIFIGQNGGSIDQYGIFLSSGIFTNETGQIIIDNTSQGIRNRSQFINQAVINIGLNEGNISSSGLVNIGGSSFFTNTNTGTIDIENTVGAAIFGVDNANMLNQGTITINDNADVFITNGSTFTNDNCASLSTLGNIAGNRPVINNGFITLSGGEITNEAFTNNGLIIYPQDVTPANPPASSIDIAPIATCTGVFDNALDVTGLGNFSIGSSWYLNEDLTGLAGTYDAGMNQFTPDASLTDGLSTLYFSIYDDINACAAPETVSINIDLGRGLTSTWTGAVSTDWNDADNWTGCVPTAQTVVTIAQGMPNNPTIAAGTAAMVKSININASGDLTIAANGALTTHSTAPATNAINVSGTIDNLGTINVENSTENAIVISFSPMGELINNGDIFIGQNGGNIGGSGILSSGLFENKQGQIVIDNVNGNGIQTASQFTNGADILIGQNGGSIGLAGIAVNSTGGFRHDDGQISIDNTISDAVQNAGIFDNVGELLIGQNDGNIGGSGILTTGTFDNCAGCGPIKIGNTTLDGIRQDAGTFTNNAQILIGQNGGNIGVTGVRLASSSFLNENGGVLVIQNSTSSGIVTSNNGNFTNRGDILIGQNGGNIGEVGILIFSPSFFTNEAGQISIDNTNNDGIQNQSQFINQAVINMGLNEGNIGRYGIFNTSGSSIFTNTNTGTIDIENTAAAAIWGQDNANMLNQGTITINDNADIFNSITSSTFTNDNCAFLSTLGNIAGGGPVINNGFITLSGGDITNTAFTNNGLIIYPRDATPANPLAGSIDIAPIATCTGVFDNALNLTSLNNFTVGSSWYLNDDLTGLAGTYDAGMNQFTPDASLADGLATLYFSISDDVNSCAASETVSIDIDLNRGLTSTWTGAVSTDWNDADNWTDCVPTAQTEVTIQQGAPNDPIIAAGTAAAALDANVQSGATLTISATASLTLGSTVGGIGLYSTGSVVNEGTLNVTNSTFAGIGLGVTGSFINRGGIFIGQGGLIDNKGIITSNLSTFTNETGQIIIDNTNSHGIFNQSQFINQAVINIGLNEGNIVGSGLFNVFGSSIFTNTNTGTINIENTASSAFWGQTNANLLNQGTITIKDDSAIFITHGSTFTNDNCASLSTLGNITGGGPVINNGFITLSGGEITNTAFTNNGLIIYPGDATPANPLAGSIDIAPIATCTGIFDNALNLTSLNNFTVGSQWYLDEDLTALAGTYDVGMNQFTPDASLADGLATLYFSISDDVNACATPETVAIDIDLNRGLISTWTGAISTDWDDADNWTGCVPTAQTEVTILQGAPNDPIIAAGTMAEVSFILVEAAGTLTIAANGSLSASSTKPDTEVMIVVGNLVNEGTIEIQNSTRQGILQYNNGNFTNRGDIFIGQNGGSIGLNGIIIFPPSIFTNEAGQISIDNTNNDGIQNQSQFINQAVINIGLNEGNIGRIGILNAGVNSTFTNTGAGKIDIDIEDTATAAIWGQSNANMLNQGTITIKDDSDVRNSFGSTFTNDNCAFLSTLGNITGSSPVINNGFITLVGGDITNTAFTNNGLIIYPGDATPANPLAGSIDIAPIATCTGVFDNALNLTSLNNFTVGSQWYLNEDLTGLAGTYDAGMNQFTPDASLADGLATLYFSISDNVNTCAASETVAIDIDLGTDLAPPVIVCPPSVSVNAPASDCFATVSFASPTATDACDPNPMIALTSGTASGNSFGIETVTNTYTATDANNNMSSCTMTITVMDNTDPTPICQDVTINLEGTTSITTADIDNGSSDACGIASLSLDMTDFECANIGTNTVTLTVTDNNNNTATCDATVTVEAAAPIISCPADIVQSSDATICGAVVDYLVTATSGNPITDLAGFTYIGSSPIGNQYFHSNNTFTWEEANIDAAVNGGHLVTISDAATNAQFHGLGSSWIGLTDEVVEGQFNWTTGELLGYTGWWTNGTASEPDDFGPDPNISQDHVFINFLYNGAWGDGSGEASFRYILELEGGVQLIETTGNFGSHSEFPVGTTNVCYQAIDNCGLMDECCFDVTIIDNTDPIALCQDITVSLDENGNGSATAEAVNNGSSDACGISSLALNITDFNCSDVGSNVIILTVTDNNGNSETCNAMANVVDEIPAEITCRQPISTTVTPGQCQREDLTVLPPFVLYDNCGIDSGHDISRTPAGNDFEVGTTTLVWTVTDSNGNPAQCESLVIVQDNEPPSVNSCTTSVDFLTPGSCMANVSIDVNAQDECGIASVEGDGEFVLPIGIHPQTITITDVNGNQTVHVVTVYVHDDQAPIVALCPQDMTVASSSIPTEVNLTEPQFSDNCGIFSIENDAPDAFPLGTTAVTYTAMDEYGNTVDCIYNVNVVSGVSFDNTIEGIEASAPTAEGVSWIDWNRPQTGTSCEMCAETDYPDYLYLGDFNGHQYFLFSGAVNWSEASILSSEMNGHLVSMNDEDENTFIQNQLPATEPDAEPTTYWTGLNDSNINIEWENGDAYDYFNFPYDILLNPDALNAAVLNVDGTWSMTSGDNETGFIIERPCVNLVQTSPLIEVISEEGDTTYVLLTPDSQWETGTYEVTYEATDMCENTASYSFEVNIAEEDAEYCNTGGTQHEVWVKRVIIEDYLMETEEAASYTDNTAEIIALSASNTVAIQLIPGGVDLSSNTDLLYWRIWLDLNNDGDFFDANEQIYETSSTSIVNLELPISTDLFGQTLRSRISVATQQYPEACLEFSDGEAEDYTLVFPEMSEDVGRSAGNFSLSPNPADNYANLNFKDFKGENVFVTVYDNLGKVRLETKAQINYGEPIRLDLRKFIDGIYFVKVQVDGQRMMTKRLVIDKFYGWVPGR